MYMVQKLELFPTSYEYSIGKYNNLKEMFVRGDVDISGNIAMSGNINCNEINSTSITATTFYGDGSQLTGINTSGGSANLNEHSDASFGNIDVSGNININGKVTITINDVDAQNITLLEMKTHSNTPRIKHDFWQNSTGYGDYQIYPASAATTDFKIGGFNSTFQTIRLNALNGIEVYSNQSTNTFGNIKCNTLELTNKIQGPSELIIDPSPYDSSGGNVTVMGNLKLKGSLGVLDSSTNNIIYGNVGSVLTSNGTGSAVSWVDLPPTPLSKVYGHAFLVGFENYTVNSGTIGTINSFNIQVNEPNNLMVNGNGGAGFKMIVRRPGFYKVEFHATIGAGDQLPTGGFLRLKHNTTPVAYSEFSDNVFTPGDKIYFFSASVSGIFYANTNDYFIADAYISNASQLIVFGDPGDGRIYTRAIIHNVD